MRRLLRLYRAVRAVRSWRPPPGVELRLVLRPDLAAMHIVLSNDEDYLSLAGPWLSLTRSEVRAKLDALARALAARGGHRDDDDDEEAEEPSEAVTAAGRQFQAAIEFRAREQRRRRSIRIDDAQRGEC